MAAVRELCPADSVPPSPKDGRGEACREAGAALGRFVGMGVPCAFMSYAMDHEAQADAQRLRSVAKADGVPVAVHKRGTRVYLRRTDL